MSAVSKKAMWQRYIDDALMLTEQITMASIHGLDGVAWANSKELEVVVFATCVTMEIQT